MIILTIRSDNQMAEVGLYDDERQIGQVVWQAHRELAETLHQKVAEVLSQAEKSLQNVNGIGVYQGPGSFTGLRIGISVANAFGYGLGVPVVGTQGDNWAEKAIDRLLHGDDDRSVVPEYGAAPNITKPKH